MFYESEDSDYSYDNSDCEYATLEPYIYELNSSKEEVIETPEEKLLKYIQNNEISEIKFLMPNLMEVDDKLNKSSNNIENINNIVLENGDGFSDDSNNEETSDCEDDEIDQYISQSVYKEIILKNGETPLMAATAEGNVELVKYFLSLGFDVNHKLSNSNKTALFCLFCKMNSSMWSIDRNSDMIDRLVQCLQILINNGADVRVRSFFGSQDYGNNALHFAVQNNYWEMLDILIEAGADIDAMNNQKLTPLHIAASKGHVSCCNILLLAGANARLVDTSGYTAAQSAEHEGYHHLSDAINIYCGNARHNVRLYKTWLQYCPMFKGGDLETSFSEFNDIGTLNHSCIESFCLALDAPFLLKLMKDQGISIADLKLMDEKKLLDLGVPETDCVNLISAIKDLSKKTKLNSKKINYAFGKPLRPVTILEMIGNIGEHIEFVDTNLESMLCHLKRNEKFYLEKFRIVNKSTVVNMKMNNKLCTEATERLLKQADNLERIIEEQQKRNGEADTQTMFDTGNRHMQDVSEQNYLITRSSSLSCTKSSVFVSLGLAVSLTALILYRRYL